MQERILIFGAGKIGRGFIGHLFRRSGYELTFIDPVASVVNQLNRVGKYPLYVLGTPQKNESIPIARAILSSSTEEAEQAISEHDLFATSVGGPNLVAVGKLLGRGLLHRLNGGNQGDANVIICENYKDPAAILRTECYATGGEEVARWGQGHLGIAETQVLRSCIEPDAQMKQKDPLAIQVQDWWVLPCDGAAFRGDPPPCEGLKLKANFQNELIRKVYTYNCSNAVISYLGYLKGYKMLYEAANDPEILDITYRAYEESGLGLIAEYQLDPSEQEGLQNLALTKYQDRNILDPIERNGRDTQRKLSPTDRLLGPATLCLKHGGTPKSLALAIAAGLHYAGSNDPGTGHVQQIMRSKGLKAAIEDVCKIDPESPMGVLIAQEAANLAGFNKIAIRLVTE
jgi:mannitol-1-phosphate 5-dehydrogenase